MCLAVPAQIIEIVDMLATVKVGGLTRKASIMLVPEAKIGDFVLVHAGFAVQIIDRREAEKTLELFREIERYEQAEQ